MLHRRLAFWLAVSVAAAGPTASAGGAASFRFVHLSDTHCITATRNPRPRFFLDPMAKNLVASFSLLEAAVRDVNEHVRPDFLIVTGDLIDRPGDIPALRRAKRILERLHCPWYPVVGNHDGQRAWTEVFGAERLNYTFVRNGWRFIAVDTSRGGIDAATRAWLTRLLDGDGRTPTAVLTHYPLVLPQAQRAAGRRLYRADLVLHGAQAIQRLLARHGNVRAVFSGHCHVPTAMRVGGIDCQTAPALVTLGHHYAIVAVENGALTTTYRAVPLPGVPAPNDGPR